MISNYETQLANEATYEADRMEGGLKPLGIDDSSEGVQVAGLGSSVGTGLRELLKGLGGAGKVKTSQILDNVDAMPAKRAELTPEEQQDMRFLLDDEQQAQRELGGETPIDTNVTQGNKQQELPFDEYKMPSGEGDLTAAQNTQAKIQQRNVQSEREAFQGNLQRAFDEMEDPESFDGFLDGLDASGGEFTSTTFSKVRAEVNTPKDIMRELGDVIEGKQTGLLKGNQIYALSMATRATADAALQTAMKINAGDDSIETMLSMSRFVKQLEFFAAYKVNNASHTGQALSMQRMISQKLKDGDLKELSGLLDELGGSTNAKYQAKLFAELKKREGEGGAEASGGFLGAVNRMRMGASNFAGEYWTASILSNPKTHVVNVTSSALQIAWDNMALKGVAAMSGAVRTGMGKITGNEVTDKVTATEVLATNVASFHQISDSMKMMAKAFVDGQGRMSGKKTDAGDVGTVENVLTFFTDTGSAANKVAKGVSDTTLSPYRFLSAEDEAFKSIQYNAEFKGLAVRQAVKEGLEGKALWDRVDELAMRPTPELHASAMEAAKRATFQDDIEGVALAPIVKGLKAGIRNVPELRFIVPFIETPLNVTKRMFEMAPVINTLTPTIWKQLNAGGAQRDIANAKIIWGMGMYYAAQKAYEAGVFTGSGPEKWGVQTNLKKEGWQPNAIKSGDAYYNIERLSPHSQSFLMVGKLMDRAKYARTEVEHHESVAAAMIILADNATQLPFLQGINNVLSIASGRQKPTDIGVKMASGFVPLSGALKGVKDLTDPTPYVPSVDKNSGFFDKAGQAIKSKLPVVSMNMRPRRYWDGTVMMPQAGQVAYAMSPFKIGVKGAESDAVNMALIDQHYAPPEANPMVTFGGVEFSLVELDAGEGKIFDEYIVRLGEKRREVFKKTINQRGYKSAIGSGQNSVKYAELVKANAKAQKAALSDFLAKDLGKLLRDAEVTSDIGKELLEKGGIKSWLKDTREGYAKRRDEDEGYEDKVKLKGKSRLLAPDDVQLNPLR